jgi:predicted hydrocarbon binding protein
MADRKYVFSWELLGNAEDGRPNMGELISIKAYRLMQFTFRDVLEAHYGAQQADRLFSEAGHLAGRHFFHNIIGDVKDFPGLVTAVQEAFCALKIGIVRIEEAQPPYERIVLTVAEDADCSGLPELDYEYCRYDEGFIAGILDAFTGQIYDVKEIDCWCTGDRVCRFLATMKNNTGCGHERRTTEI